MTREWKLDKGLLKKIVGISIGVLVLGIVLSTILKKSVVKGIEIKSVDYSEDIVVSGIIKGANSSSLSFKIGGEVAEILVKEGDFVKKGDVVAKLDMSTLTREIESVKSNVSLSASQLTKNDEYDRKIIEENLRIAEKELELAESEYSRYEKLYDEGHLSLNELEGKRKGVLSVEKNVNNLREQLRGVEGAVRGVVKKGVLSGEVNLNNLLESAKDYVLYSPYDGYILSKSVDIGEGVSPFKELFTITSDLDKVVEMSIDEKYLGTFNSGSRIKVYPYNSDKKSSDGLIYDVAIAVDNNGSVKAKGTIESPLPEFLYNSNVNVVIQGNLNRGAIIIPNKFVFNEGEKNFVYKFTGGKSKKSEIKAKHVADGLLVSEGLEEGDTILLPENLKDGKRVKIDYNLKEEKTDFTGLGN